jgi:hypothetical protein
MVKHILQRYYGVMARRVFHFGTYFDSEENVLPLPVRDAKMRLWEALDRSASAEDATSELIRVKNALIEMQSVLEAMDATGFENKRMMLEIQRELNGTRQGLEHGLSRG